ncbi:hypothetical protein SAMN04489867_2746 [Pedococcus dokdonensis]|uniref:Uncharacterized protein n=1 Tax=Pedococcus dokdonensis TaxID=443156 RepID=A0A1H0TEJ0_9MICO|nr:hypothetical protein [Pedococcus dokdonensis]SDP51926.1 hypothetical protein SAMN04489867_2746 [Pedococcus dokdonensis]
MSTDLRALLQSSLLPAMRVGDKDTVAVVRAALAAIANAEAVPVADDRPLTEGPVAGAAVGLGVTEAPRRELSEAEVRELVERERQERVHAAEESEAGGLGEYAARLRTQAAILGFLLERTA